MFWFGEISLTFLKISFKPNYVVRNDEIIFV